MEKIRFIKSSYPNFLGSFFNFGTVEMLAEGDNPDNTSSLKLEFVESPTDTVNLINKLLINKGGIGASHPILDKILSELGLIGHDILSPVVKSYVGNYLEHHDDHMQELYRQGTPPEKDEIIQIYKQYKLDANSLNPPSLH